MAAAHALGPYVAMRLSGQYVKALRGLFETKHTKQERDRSFFFFLRLRLFGSNLAQSVAWTVQPPTQVNLLLLRVLCTAQL